MLGSARNWTSRLAAGIFSNDRSDGISHPSRRAAVIRSFASIASNTGTPIDTSERREDSMDGSRGAIFRLFFKAADELADAIDRLFEFGHRAAITGAHVSLAAGTEGIAGDDRDALLFE